MPRPSLCVLVLALVATPGCSSDDPTVERRGGKVPSPEGSAGDAAVSSGGAGSGDEQIPFCDALAVIRAKCQRCHQQPPQHGAPVPFLTYEDIVAPYGSSTEFKYSDAMIPAVENGFMPYVVLNDPPTSLMPPVEPLTEPEKATLLGWLKQGAKPVGGTDCPKK